jgi:hypothetical protein
MKTAAICLLLTVALALHAGVPIRWTVETSAFPTAYELPIMRGETVQMSATLRTYGANLIFGTNTAVVLYWQTNGMGSLWWPAAGALASNTLSATWLPSYDVGASSYTFYIGATNATDGRIYRAWGRIRMLGAPGDPTSGPLPTPTAAWDARYDLAGTANGVSNALAASLQAEASTRSAADIAACTNHIAALAAEALLRSQGDAASIAASATNRVFRLSGTNCWQTVENGISYVYSVTADTNRVRIVSASPSFNGPSAGSWFIRDNEGFFTNASVFYCYMTEDASAWMLIQGAEDIEWKGPAGVNVPVTLVPYTGEETAGSCVIDYGTITNRAPQASEATVIILADKVDAIPLPPTNAINGWLVWDGGSNRYWRVSATNLRFYVWGDL